MYPEPVARRAPLAALCRAACGVVVVLFASAPRAASACDICAIYTATEMSEARRGVRLGLAEQFTSYDTLQLGGREVPNPAGERLQSSITQVFAGYNFGPRGGLQMNLPIIARAFRRQEATKVVNGDESGVGDLSVIAHLLPVGVVSEHSVVRLLVLGGLKLPSGNSRRLKEELAETADVGEGPGPFGPGGLRKYHRRDGAAQSGVHGHDLALGSGSTDAIVGSNLFASWDRLFLTGSAQYAIRTTGDFGYRYADDLTCSGGPGVYALLDHRYTLSLQALVSAESKGSDQLKDVTLDDTARTGVFAGPMVIFTWGTSLSADLGLDVSALQNNSGLQAVPDYRVRAGLTWRL